MKLILISSAEEAALFLKNKNEWSPLSFNELMPWQGFQKQEWIVLICGIGLTNATAALTWIYCVLKANTQLLRQIILLGCSGSLRKDLHAIGDCLLIDTGYYLYADATYFGYDFGQIPKESKYFKADSKLNQKIMHILSLNKPLANIASCNSFITNQNYIVWPQKESWPFSLIDMEATAVLHTAAKFNLPAAVIKVISDFVPEDAVATPENFHKYETNIYDVSTKINDIINALTS